MRLPRKLSLRPDGLRCPVRPWKEEYRRLKAALPAAPAAWAASETRCSARPGLRMAEPYLLLRPSWLPVLLLISQSPDPPAAPPPRCVSPRRIRSPACSLPSPSGGPGYYNCSAGRQTPEHSQWAHPGQPQPLSLSALSPARDALLLSAPPERQQSLPDSASSPSRPPLWRSLFLYPP